MLNFFLFLINLLYLVSLEFFFKDGFLGDKGWKRSGGLIFFLEGCGCSGLFVEYKYKLIVEIILYLFILIIRCVMYYILCNILWLIFYYIY